MPPTQLVIECLGGKICSQNVQRSIDESAERGFVNSMSTVKAARLGLMMFGTNIVDLQGGVDGPAEHV